MPVSGNTLTFKRCSKRFKVKSGPTLMGWIQDFYFYGKQKPTWMFRMSPNSYLLNEDDLLLIAGFLSAINEAEPLA